MGRLLVLFVAAMLVVPAAAMAADIEEFELGGTAPNMSSANTPMPSAAAVSKPVATAPAAPAAGAAQTKAVKAPAPKPVVTKQAVAVKPAGAQKKAPAKANGAAAQEPVRYSSRALYDGREGHFQAGFVGPGFGVANKGIGPMMTMGVEGEYFFWEHLSAGMRIEVATEFDHATILSFVPRARYVFDFDSHPRWSAYVQGGVGLALYNGKHAAADISIPGGGFWWKWTDRWSVGADTNFHLLVRSDTAFEWTIGPAIRYLF